MELQCYISYYGPVESFTLLLRMRRTMGGRKTRLCSAIKPWNQRNRHSVNITRSFEDLPPHLERIENKMKPEELANLDHRCTTIDRLSVKLTVADERLPDWLWRFVDVLSPQMITRSVWGHLQVFE